MRRILTAALLLAALITTSTAISPAQARLHVPKHVKAPILYAIHHWVHVTHHYQRLSGAKLSRYGYKAERHARPQDRPLRLQLRHHWYRRAVHARHYWKTHRSYLGSSNAGLGLRLAAARGWTGSQFSCLYALWNRESGWSVTAANPSGAYGIPQALPGSKMGPGWATSALVQIRWGLGYIAARYGTPCAAWAHSEAYGWY